MIPSLPFRIRMYQASGVLPYLAYQAGDWQIPRSFFHDIRDPDLCESARESRADPPQRTEQAGKSEAAVYECDAGYMTRWKECESENAGWNNRE